MEKNESNLEKNQHPKNPDAHGEKNQFISNEGMSDKGKTSQPAPGTAKIDEQNFKAFKHSKENFHKKSWKEYLLEFFMLFLAVYLGFLAENLREHLVDKNHEKEYIHGLIEDINANNTNAEAVIDDFQNRLPHLDTMVNDFGDFMRGRSNEFFRNMAFIGSYKDFYITDGTMQQLKNAGGLRLIRKKEVSDSILHYDGTTKILLLNQDFLNNNIFTPLWRLQGTLIDTYKLDSLQKLQELPPYNKLSMEDILLTHDRQKLVEYYSGLSSLKFNIISWIHRLSEFKKEGERLIALLKKEYHF